MTVSIEKMNNDCVSIRLSEGTTNTLRTTLLKDLSSAIKSVTDENKGIIFSGGGLAIFLACDYRYASTGHVNQKFY